MISEAIQNNPSFLTLRRIEAARENAKYITRSNNRLFIDSDLLLFDLDIARYAADPVSSATRPARTSEVDEDKDE